MGYNLETSGDYAVTGHAAADAPPFYLAWWKQDVIGQRESKDEARSVCEQHNGKRS